MSNPKVPKTGKNHGVVSICSKVSLEGVGCWVAWGSCFALVRLDRFAIIQVSGQQVSGLKSQVRIMMYF